MVESGMVCLREGDNDLSWSLIQCKNLNAVRHQPSWGEHSDELEEQVGLLLKQFRDRLLHGFFKLVGIRCWDPVPSLGFTPVHVVDRIGIVVLVVPAEGREAHSNVKPWHHHSRDVRVNVAEERVLKDGNVIKVGWVARVLVLGVTFACRKTAIGARQERLAY